MSQFLYCELLFRKFCHLEVGGDVPETSTLGRFRNQLVEYGFWKRSTASLKETCDKLERLGIVDQVQRRRYRNNPLSVENRRRNDEIAVIRAGGERPFATYKSRYGLVRSRFTRLTKNMTAYGIAAIAHNLRKGAKFLSLHGLLDPNYTG